MTALERLDQIDARTTAATGAPWTPDVRFVGVKRLAGSKTVAATDLPDDATFIAHAREDVPAMLTALRAILALHAPEEHRGHQDCTGCEQRYPCTTVTIIETELTR